MFDGNVVWSLKHVENYDTVTREMVEALDIVSLEKEARTQQPKQQQRTEGKGTFVESTRA